MENPTVRRNRFMVEPAAGWFLQEQQEEPNRVGSGYELNELEEMLGSDWLGGHHVSPLV